MPDKERQINRLESKLDDICSTVGKIDKEVFSLKNLIVEREKTEILRNEVIVKTLDAQREFVNSLNKKVGDVEAELKESKKTVLGLSFSVILMLVGYGLQILIK